MSRNFIPNAKNYLIKTPNGFEPFAGISNNGKKQTFKIIFDNNSEIEGTDDHILFLLDGSEIKIQDIKIDDILMGIANKRVTQIILGDIIDVYDIIEIPSHTFFANGILSHNCEFISNDPLLFSSRYVITYKTDPLPEPDARGVVWFDSIDSSKTHLIAVDPATGSGSDYTVILLYSFPDMQQIAEFRSNVMSSPLAYNIVKYMLKLLQSKGVETVYWSLENNGVGEGMLSLQSIDENPVEIGELLSDKGKRRLGFNTGKNKLTLCITFKQMFETGRIKIKSKNTINEMKNFVRKNGSYSARSGSTDDTISAHLILMRMLDELVRYEDDAYALMYESDFINEFSDDTNYVEPTPIVTSNSGDQMDVWSWYENHR